MAADSSLSPHRARTAASLPLLALLALAALGPLSVTAAAQPSCTVDDGRTGTCQRLGACRGQGVAVPGFCPGNQRVQCCVPRETEPDRAESTDEDPSVDESSGAEANATGDEAVEPSTDDGAQRAAEASATSASRVESVGAEDLSGLPPLERAQRAYRNIDLVTASDSAMEAIESGTLSPSELVSAYEIHGTATAALGDDQVSKDSFTRMLALDPERSVRDLSPALRAPYLQARGQISMLETPFGVDVGISRPSSSITVRLTDPMQLAATVIVRTRVGGQGEFVEERFAANGAIRQRLDGISDAGWAESAVEVQDEHGNQLRVIGTADEPITLGEPLIVVESRPAWKSPWLWTMLGLVVLGGAGVGLYYGLRPDPYDAQLGVCFGCF